MTNRFAKIQVHGWRQFRKVEFNFHPRLTIITGANGAGKTTILNVLSEHFGWSFSFVGTLRVSKQGARKYFSGVFDDDLKSSNAEVGKLAYTNGGEASLVVPREGEVVPIYLNGRQEVPGIYITSHRPVYSYQKVTSIPTEVQAGEQLFQQYLQNLRQQYQPQGYVESPSHRLKAALISLANFGYGNRVVQANTLARKTFEGFSDVLTKVLPEDLGFKQIAVRMPEVVLECDGGDFSIDAASGGIAALIDLAWQVFMQSRASQHFTVVMDEPENHLHPRLQRSVLPGLLKAFPGAQFVVATHNPFVVTSVQDSAVVVLDFVDGRVESTSLPDVDRSASANKVLTDVLGVEFPIPLWVEDEVDKVVQALADEELTPALLSSIRDRLNVVGLGHLFPQVVDRLLPATADDRKEAQG